MGKSRRSDRSAVFFFFLLFGALLTAFTPSIGESTAAAFARRLPSRFPNSNTTLPNGNTS